ncbi:MAG: glutaminyl-peptide cyclotransferase, partial [Deltaproteobacteria bacterium]|nr:glutaminyl-peptide cyclotransferase [Deltaproteobacteria bacterium]
FDSPANGIAYDEENDSLLVTGKYWPYIFRIKLPQDKQI